MFLLWWGKVDSDHRSQWQQIYSLPPLAAREFPHIWYIVCCQDGAGEGSWTPNLLITNQLLCHWATPAWANSGQLWYYSMSFMLCQGYFLCFFIFLLRWTVDWFCLHGIPSLQIKWHFPRSELTVYFEYILEQKELCSMMRSHNEGFENKW